LDYRCAQCGGPGAAVFAMGAKLRRLLKQNQSLALAEFA
jgi:hypothetical protein